MLETEVVSLLAGMHFASNREMGNHDESPVPSSLGFQYCKPREYDGQRITNGFPD